jgi:hypothetical protein
MRKSISSTVAWAGLASLMLLYPAGPAAARKMTCLQKAQACESRCARAYRDYLPCIYRTCGKQYGTCGRE